MPPKSSAERCCVLLQTPVPLKLIVRIKVAAKSPLKEAELPTRTADQDVPEDAPAMVEASVRQVYTIPNTVSVPGQ